MRDFHVGANFLVKGRRMLVMGAGVVALAMTARADLAATSRIVDYAEPLADGQIVLKNDSFRDEGSEGQLQMGFVKGEKAGIWVKVPAEIPLFKVDYFRVLITSGKLRADLTATAEDPVKDDQLIYYQLGIANEPAPQVPNEMYMAAQVTPGPYWNDIPAQVSGTRLGCAKGGQFVGAALEFAHDGLPSIVRDMDGLTSPQHNVIYAIPGGWKYSAQYGLRGDWVLRIVGHPAKEGECQ